MLGVPYIIPCSELPSALGKFLFSLNHLNSHPGPRVPCGKHRGAEQLGDGLGQSRQEGPASIGAEAAETLRRRGKGQAVATVAPGGLGNTPLPSRPSSRVKARREGRRSMRKLRQSPHPASRRRAGSGLQGQRGGGRGLHRAELGRLTHSAAAASASFSSSSSFPSCCCCSYRRLSASAEGGTRSVCAERGGRARQRRGAERSLRAARL